MPSLCQRMPGDVPIWLESSMFDLFPGPAGKIAWLEEEQCVRFTQRQTSTHSSSNHCTQQQHLGLARQKTQRQENALTFSRDRHAAPEAATCAHLKGLACHIHATYWGSLKSMVTSEWLLLFSHSESRPTTFSTAKPVAGCLNDGLLLGWALLFGDILKCCCKQEHTDRHTSRDAFQSSHWILVRAHQM